MNLEKEVPRPHEPKHPGKQDEPPEPEPQHPESEPEEEPAHHKMQ